MTHRVTLTPEIEAQMIAAIVKNNNAHIVMPASAYRADGSLMVHRDNLSGIRAQRHLYRQLIGELERTDYLRPTCKIKGCLNPYHYKKSTRSTPPATHCPNGHEYTPENTLPDGRARCRICHEASLAKRRKPHVGISIAEINRAKTECKHHHPFTPENTYISLWNNQKRRRCRTCAIESANRNRRERAKQAQEEAS